MEEKMKQLIQQYNKGGFTQSELEWELLNLFSVSQRNKLLAFKQFISKTPLTELELYSDEEFTDLYIKDNCSQQNIYATNSYGFANIKK